MTFSELLAKIKEDFPEFIFQESDHFSWDCKLKKISYIRPKEEKLPGIHTSRLLHELAHAKLNHREYLSDSNLLQIESEAWLIAKELSQKYGIKLSSLAQKKALLSYINWASSRSRCPKCKKNGLQTAQAKFICPNCQNQWKVGKSRFKRTYRQS